MKVGLTLIGILVITLFNIPPGKYLAAWIIDSYHYRYCNYSGSFTFTDQGHYEASHLKDALTSCLKENAPLLAKPITAKDRVVYRLFWRNPICFWRWYDYCVNPAYKLPYISWAEVEARRKQLGTRNLYCQSF